ncbi:MAG: AMP-binding protein [Candidatus Eisenbacteria bacterium]|nr:AMP-binding protein [Candidatus Latescibacterota bacterium]MBD3302554.1 AMP-binding protein [Candidatus Eisenbacteria bacterium]
MSSPTSRRPSRAGRPKSAHPPAAAEAASAERSPGSGVPAQTHATAHPLSLSRLLAERSRGEPSRLLLLELESGRAWTVEEIDRYRRSCTGSLAGHGIRPGDRIAVEAEPCGQTLGWLLAVWDVGAVFQPLLPRLPLPEKQRLLRGSGARIVVDPVSETIEKGQPGAVDPEPAEEGTALLFTTSGTSGRPKGVPHTHMAILANLEALGLAWGLTERDRLLSCLPWNHVHGLWIALLGALLHRFPIIQARRFPGAGPLIEAIDTLRPTLVYGVPTFWSDLTAPETPPPSPAHRLRLAVSGSAALSQTIRRRIQERFGVEPLERYGMTEAGMILSQRLRADRRNDPGAVPLPGVEVRTTEEGELEIRGPSVMRGYWRDANATREAFRDGWFRTGDLVEREGSGYRIVGRTSIDVIKCRGFKIAAPEIEEAILSWADVRECAVIGVPHDRLGEEIVAWIVPGVGVEIEEEELIRRLRSRLSGSKIPQRFLFVDALPRTPVGKIAKSLLRERSKRAAG